MFSCEKSEQKFLNERQLVPKVYTQINKDKEKLIKGRVQ